MSRLPNDQLLVVQGPTLLSADDVAKMLGYGVDWVREQTRRGRIPHVKLGRYPRYRLETIESWIADNERMGGI
jgi:excisionase family DNA binding protein